MKRKPEPMRLSKGKSLARRRYTASVMDKAENVEAERYLQRYLMPVLRYAKERGIDLKAEFEKYKATKRGA